MINTILRTCLVALVAALLPLNAGRAQLRKDSFLIGTGSSAGVYSILGRAICKLYYKANYPDEQKCLLYPTPGSIFNLNALADGSLQFALVQSDWQYHAYKGTSVFARRGPSPELRSVFSAYPEAFTVVAAAGSGIHNFDDLKGKRVNIGSPGSGQHGTMQVLMAARNWTRDDFRLVYELGSDAQASALCQGFIDAFVYVVGNPNPSIRQAVENCGASLVPVEGPAVDKLVAEHDYYVETTIPAGVYKGIDTPVKTFGVSATLMTTAGTDDRTVSRLVKAVFDGLDQLRAQHPAFAGMTPEKMVSQGLTAPLHEAALKFYQEKGWK